MITIRMSFIDIVYIFYHVFLLKKETKLHMHRFYLAWQFPRMLLI